MDRLTINLLLKLLSNKSNSPRSGEFNTQNRIRSLLVEFRELLDSHLSNTSSSPDTCLSDLLHELQLDTNGNSPSSSTSPKATSMCAATEEKCRAEINRLKEEMVEQKRAEQDKLAQIIVQSSDEVRKITSERDDLRLQLSSCQSLNSDLEKSVTESLEEVANGKQVIQQKDQEIREREERIRGLSEDVRRAQETIQDLQSNAILSSKQILETQASLKKLTSENQNKEHEICELHDKVRIRESEVESLSADLLKANEIIRKLQDEVAKAKQKVDILSKVSTRQDDLVSDKDKKMKQLESDLKLCISRIRRKEEEQEKQISELTRLRKQFDESQEQIRSNHLVISGLNEQIADLNGKMSEAEKTAAGKKKPASNMSTRTGLVNRNIGSGRGLSANSSSSGQQQQQLTSQQLRTLRQQPLLPQKISGATGQKITPATSRQTASGGFLFPPEPQPTEQPLHPNLFRTTQAHLPHVNLIDKHMMNIGAPEATTEQQHQRQYQMNPLFALGSGGAGGGMIPSNTNHLIHGNNAIASGPGRGFRCSKVVK